MRIACVILLATAFVAIAARPVEAGPDDGGGPPLIPGARQVHIRNASGGVGVYTRIPGGSAFSRHGGGTGTECSGVAEGDDPDTLDVVEATRPIRSTRWIFIEGLVFEMPFPGDLSAYDPVQSPGLDS